LERTFGGSAIDWGISVQQTEGGGYILLGCTSSYGAGGLDFWLIHISVVGYLWREFPGHCTHNPDLALAEYSG
jgi:hypothetical protein